ncbi:MAG: camphor resistance protein CrcB [Caulobacterales bacterium 32-67-6]|nr:MAG: camphor resistance protein CrcB [Caulobacterales bacterium 32-67-6]
MDALAYLLVGVGGAIGGGSRFVVSAAIGKAWGERFPWGTLGVNVSGALLIGVVAGIGRLTGDGAGHTPMDDLVITGVLGGYTTVSSFCMQTINLVLAKSPAYAAINVVASTVLCLIAVFIGYFGVMSLGS